MNKVIVFILALLFCNPINAKDECTTKTNSKGKSGIGKLGTSYDYNINRKHNYYNFGVNINSTKNKVKLGDRIRINLDVYNPPHNSKLNYFWRDSCNGKILSSNDDCTQIDLTILQDVEKECHLQAEVQDGLGYSKIATLQYEIDTSNSGYDYRLEVSPKYVEGKFYKQSIFNLSLKHNKPAYDKTVTLNKTCYFDGELEWKSDPLTYSPDFDKEHTWTYTPESGYGLRRCDLSVVVEGDIDNSNNSASVFINITDPNPPVDNKDIYIQSATITSKSSNISQGETIKINAVQAFNGTTLNHFVSSLGYFLSKDHHFSSDDRLLAEDRSGLNNNKHSDNENTRWTVPKNQDDGVYYIILVADYKNEHSDKNRNNNVYPIKITIKDQRVPNLFFNSVSIEGKDSKIELGSDTALTVQLGNSGNKSSGNGIIKFYRSTDANISISDTYVASSTFKSIDASKLGDSIYRSLLGPTTIGEYWYGACVVPVLGESNISDNCSIATKVLVIEGKPNLTTDSLTIPTSVDKDITISAKVKIKNIGSKSSTVTNVAIYYSINNLISRDVHKVGQSSVPTVNAKSEKIIKINAKFPEAGSKWVFACVGGNGLEDSDRSIESNCTTPKVINIIPPDNSSNQYIEKFYNEFTWYFGSKSGANYNCDSNMVCQNFSGGWNSVNKVIKVRLSDNYLYWKVGSNSWNNAGIRY